jgi:hypothetical protein
VRNFAITGPAAVVYQVSPENHAHVIKLKSLGRIYAPHLIDPVQVRGPEVRLIIGIPDLAFYTPDVQVQFPDGTIDFHEVEPGYRQKLKDGTRREAPFCFEDAKLKIRVAAALFDEFGFLIVFPLKAGGWGRVAFGSRPVALSKATCALQEAHCGA